MKAETSAGGVIVRKMNSVWHVLCIRDMNSSWTFPKGLIEPDETREAAAAREIQEETGLTHVSLHAPIKSIKYIYRKNGLIQKTVHYFLFILTRDQPVVCQKSEGIKEAKWMSFPDAKKSIGYRDTNVDLLERVQKILTL
jgi:8-oxo-dGTP pyrophosphatase MutT (NUDIX family)